MRILVFAPYYLPGYKGGGPIRTISNIFNALEKDVEFSLVTSDRDLGDNAPYPNVPTNSWTKAGNHRIFYLSPENFLRTSHEIISSFDGSTLYLNSFFSFQYSIIPLLIWKIKQKKTILLSPRGEFSPGALVIKPLKKRLFISMSRLFNVYKNVIWHASSEHEATDIRNVFGPAASIRIAINISTPAANLNLEAHTKGSPLKLIFISRISPKKNLLGAIKLLTNITSPVVFDIYGPVEDHDYWEQCQQAAAQLPSHVVFQYRGALHPDAISSTLMAYDLFLFPTLGENFGHVIAEAISAGLPVLISDQTPWRGLQEKGLGWEFPLNQPEKFKAAVSECLEKSPLEYHEWRKNIRAWALANIGNQDAIEQNRQLFSNLK